MSTEESQVIPAEVEAHAKSLGWAPKEQWRGPAESWVDAPTFVKRGEEVMPILRENNKRLQGTVDELKTQLKAATEAIGELKSFNTEMAKEQAKKMRAELIQGISKAREDGDVEGEVELTEKLAETRQAIVEAETKPVVKTPDPNDRSFEQNPDWIATKEVYPWWGTDSRRTALAVTIGNEFRQNGDTTTGEVFFKKVAAEVESMLGGRRDSPDKVGGGRGAGNGNVDTGGKTFSDLPADAKAACKRQGEKLVGKGRAYATEADWQKHYVNLYFGE